MVSTLVFWTTAAIHAQEEERAAAEARVTFVAARVDVDDTPRDGRENFKPASVDMPVPEGSIIRTGKDAMCEITLPDGSLLRIASGSVFRVETVASGAQTGQRAQRFTLIFGKLKAKAQKLASADSTFEVASGTALAGVRGTVFGMTFDGEKSEVLVFEGSVTLSSTAAGSETLVIDKKRMSVLGAGREPGRVKKIPKEVSAQWSREFGDFDSPLRDPGRWREVPAREGEGGTGGRFEYIINLSLRGFGGVRDKA
jgi:hypothetical protein